MMHVPATAVAVFVTSAALFAYASWVAARPADPLKPRMLPWRTVSVFAGFAAFITLIYLVLAFTGRAS